ncbi:EAL domain-containing protein [Paenibacillus zeisoli]|uniref:EAL domain-containing protein n=2 Tax=Paenibacillus zeisoli TaxID=2496267 RepID=A0A3S1DAZ1_9BACL|nr:EAL domain-containing protein [Paenibacillus zeisoli]
MTKQHTSRMHPSSLFTYFQYLNQARKKEMMDYRRFVAFHHIMRNQALSTFFQPILNLDKGENVGYEILNRPPASELFPTTEHFYDFVGQTDQVSLFEMGCRQISLRSFREKAAGLPERNNSLIFMNVHPHALSEEHITSGELLELVEQYGLSPGQIVFELTEKQAVTDYETYEGILASYRAAGFRIAIDDAGSGYNSLKTLVYLKPEYVKLDRSLIQDIHLNPVQQQIVTILVEYANKSGTQVIAEGIERMEELAYLRERGVHMGQGYALGRPSSELIRGVVPDSGAQAAAAF